MFLNQILAFQLAGSWGKFSGGEGGLEGGEPRFQAGFFISPNFLFLFQLISDAETSHFFIFAFTVLFFRGTGYQQNRFKPGKDNRFCCGGFGDERFLKNF